MIRNFAGAGLAAEIERRLRQMPAAEREIFLAIRVDNLSYEEIADRSGCTVEEVETQFANALARLAESVESGPAPRCWQRIWRQLQRRT